MLQLVQQEGWCRKHDICRWRKDENTCDMMHERWDRWATHISISSCHKLLHYLKLLDIARVFSKAHTPDLNQSKHLWVKPIRPPQFVPLPSLLVLAVLNDSMLLVVSCSFKIFWKEGVRAEQRSAKMPHFAPSFRVFWRDGQRRSKVSDHKM